MSDPTFVLIQTTGWDEVALKDGPTDSIAVSVMLPVSGHEGKWFTKECESPQALWDFLCALDRDRDTTLAWNFDYLGPPKPKTADELLNELGLL